MSVEAEQAIVAGVIAHVEGWDAVAGQLTADDFTNDRMRLLFELVGKLRDKGLAADTITMAARLARSERWLTTGTDDPLEFLYALQDAARAFRSLPSYVEIVRAATVSRRLSDYAMEVVALARDDTLSAEQKISELSARMPTLDAGSSDGFVTYGDAVKDAVREILARQSGEISGVSSGMAHIDRMTGGWEPGTLVILGGRPSHGKSAYALDFAHAASSAGSVLVFSLEMTRANLAMRGLSSVARVNFGDLRVGRVADDTEKALTAAGQRMKTMPLWIDDRGGISVDQLRTRARVMARQEKPALIITDYLTLLSGVGNNRTEQIGYVSRSLKAMAKELDVPVICLAQLNRGVDSRPEKRPTLSDLRDSGEIEQDADIVMFTYLHEKYDADTPRVGCGELIFAKQRNGETGSLFCKWEGQFQHFTEWHGEIPPERSDQPKSSTAANGMGRFAEEPF